jgi:hypothetical protein
MSQLRKNSAIFVVILMLLAIAAISSVHADGSTPNANITVTATSNSDIVAVTGTGFNTSEQVYFSIVDSNSFVVYDFPNTGLTDSNGNFTDSLVIPPGFHGAYTITAQTSGVAAWTDYTFSALVSTIGATLTATPDNSNIIEVAGSGFNTSETVSFGLLDAAGSLAYKIPKNATTDNQGTFSTIVIIPTTIRGTYTMFASTSSVTAYADISVPNLVGPAGETGATGATGAAGTAGISANSSIVYASIALSIAAIVVALFVLIKKR